MKTLPNVLNPQEIKQEVDRAEQVILDECGDINHFLKKKNVPIHSLATNCKDSHRHTTPSTSNGSLARIIDLDLKTAGEKYVMTSCSGFQPFLSQDTLIKILNHQGTLSAF